MKKIYLQPFEDYLIDIKISFSNGTYKFYESHLMHFGRFLFENNITSPGNISKEITIEYLSMLRNTVTNSTINKRVGIIKRCLLFYGINQHYIHSIKKFKEKKRHFEMIPDEDLKRIIGYIGRLDSDKGNNLMYQCIIFLLINTGIRFTELAKIEKRNVRVKELEILLTKTKTNKDRVVYFRPIIANTIEKMLLEKSDHKFLIHNRLKNRPLNYNDINYLFRKLKEKLQLKKLHPHMFRHTFATKLLQTGVDIKTAMDLMGHDNMSTTQRYQHSDKEHAKKTYLNNYRY